MKYKPKKLTDDPKFNQAKEEATDDSFDLYQEYYPTDLDYWSQEQIEEVIYDRVLYGLMIYAPNITEELAGKWFENDVRPKVLKLEPFTRPLFQTELLNRNPYAKENIKSNEPVENDSEKAYKEWVRKIYTHYNAYKDNIKFNSVIDKRGVTHTVAEFPEAQTKFGEFNWDTGQGTDFNVKALKVYPEEGFLGQEYGYEEAEVEARMENWERAVMDTWDIRIPGFRNRVRFVNLRTPEGHRGIGAEISTMPKLTFGLFDLKSLQGRVRNTPIAPDDYDPPQRAYNAWKERVWSAHDDDIVDVRKKYYLETPDGGNTIQMKIPGFKEPLGTFNARTFMGQVNLNWGDEGKVKEDTDPDTEKLNIWKQSVISRYPNLKDRIRFVSKDQGKHISAEIPGMDRSFGVFDMDTMTGHVLSESKGVTKKVFEGFVSELNNIAGIYK